MVLILNASMKDMYRKIDGMCVVVCYMDVMGE